MEALLRKLNIPASTDPAALKALLEEKQAEYLDRLDHVTDEKRKGQLEETLKEMETVLASLSWTLKQQQAGIVRDTPRSEDFSSLKGRPEADRADRSGKAQAPSAVLDDASPDPYARAVALLSTPGYEKGVELLKQLAQAGDARAQYKLGSLYCDGERVQKNMAEGFRWYLMAAQQGLVAAQVNAAWMYETGNGVLKDDRQAAEWYQKAAEQADTFAQYRLSWHYRNGEGVPQDLALSLRWLEQAAKAGNPDAQFDLAYAYHAGVNGMVEQNFERAAEWYQKAADGGHAIAWSNLGVLYRQGTGVPQSTAKAVACYEKASKMGSAIASANLAHLYINGEGVPQDMLRALELYRKAAQSDPQYQQHVREVEQIIRENKESAEVEARLQQPRAQLDGDRKRLMILSFVLSLIPIWIFNSMEQFMDGGSVLVVVVQFAVAFLVPFFVMVVYRLLRHLRLQGPVYALPRALPGYLIVLIAVYLVSAVVLSIIFGQDGYDKTIAGIILIVRLAATVLVFLACLRIRTVDVSIQQASVNKK